MKIADFPVSAGKLKRRKAEKDLEKFTFAVYTLDRDINDAPKYGAIRHVQFRVKPVGETFLVHIGEKPFRHAHSMGDVTVVLIQAFDQECIRAGIMANSPRTQAPPDTDGFRNPRG